MIKYSQLKAMLAVTKASLLATFRSPQSIFFSLFFPIVLIWIFGSLAGGGSAPTVAVAFEKGIDSSTVLYQQLAHDPFLKFTGHREKDVED
jgi:ABC-2 type transport system permease protein